MDKHPLDVERLIGWLSFACGISALQPNDSTFYRLAEATAPLLWVGTFCLLGFSLVVSTYLRNTRCRIVLLVLLLLAWGGGLALVSATGPLGAFGSAAIVIIVFLVQILRIKLGASID